MNDIQKLQNLLENEFLPDLEVAIDELFAEIDKARNATKAQKDEIIKTEIYYRPSILKLKNVDKIKEFVEVKEF